MATIEVPIEQLAARGGTEDLIRIECGLPGTRRDAFNARGRLPPDGRPSPWSRRASGAGAVLRAEHLRLGAGVFDVGGDPAARVAAVPVPVRHGGLALEIECSPPGTKRRRSTPSRGEDSPGERTA
ncbi:hypothetical protein GCM10023083_40970 [Streptomyces phyllanthi]